MKTTISHYEFERAFRDCDRFDNFGYEGLKVLWEYLEEYEDRTGEEIELDVIALCCEYSHDAWEDVASNYNIDLSECECEDEKREAVREYLDYNTSLCGETSIGFVYAIF